MPILIRNNSSESLNTNQDDISVNSSANVVSVTDVSMVEDTNTEVMTCGSFVTDDSPHVYFLGSNVSVGSTFDSAMSIGGSLGSELGGPSTVASVLEVNMDGVYPGVAAAVHVIDNINFVKLYYGSK